MTPCLLFIEELVLFGWFLDLFMSPAHLFFFASGGTLQIDEVKFTAYNAGHVLGAAMIELEIAGVKVCCVERRWGVELRAINRQIVRSLHTATSGRCSDRLHWHTVQQHIVH